MTLPAASPRPHRPHPDAPRAVVLLSGGLDSATCAAIAIHAGFNPVAITFDYGQRHRHEIRAARNVARSLHIADHRVVAIDLRGIGGSALTDAIDVPKDRDDRQIAANIPVTYVPARNTVFLAYALALAEVVGAADLYIGVNAVDYSGYPDCRPEFIEAFEKLANLATRAGVEGSARFRIHAPLLHLTKQNIIEKGRALGVDYALTHSCYDPSPDGAPCQRCDACLIRIRAFQGLGLSDPSMD